MIAWIKDLLIVLIILIFGLVLFGKIPLYWTFDGKTHIVSVGEAPPEVKEAYRKLNIKVRGD